MERVVKVLPMTNGLIRIVNGFRRYRTETVEQISDNTQRMTMHNDIMLKDCLHIRFAKNEDGSIDVICVAVNQREMNFFLWDVERENA